MGHEGTTGPTGLDRSPERKMRYMDSTEETDLIMRILAGDAEAISHLWMRHYPAGVAFARRDLSVSLDDAEDLATDAFERALASIESLKSASKFRSWYFRILLNCRLNIVRTADYQRTQRSNDEQELSARPACAEASEPEVIVLREQEQAEVREAVDLLKPTDRAAVLLCHFEGKSYAEIAAELNTSEGAVGTRLTRARRALAKRLGHLCEGRQANGD